MPDHAKTEEMVEVEAPLPPEPQADVLTTLCVENGERIDERPDPTAERVCADCGQPWVDFGPLGGACGCAPNFVPSFKVPQPPPMPKTCILADCERPAAVAPGLCRECSDKFTPVRGGPQIVETLSSMLKSAGHDPVNRPSHYTQGGIECIDAIEAAVTGLTGIEAVCTGVAIKYLWRWKLKNGAEDLEKAIWYINHLIKKEKR